MDTMWESSSAAAVCEHENGASTPATPQHISVDNSYAYTASPQSPSPRHSSYALRRLSEEREKNRLLMQQLHEQQTAPTRNNTYLNHIKDLQRELQMETQRRIEAERRIDKYFMYNLDDDDEPGDGKVYPSMVANASPLLSIEINPQNHRIDNIAAHNSTMKHLIQRAHRLLGVATPQDHDTLKLLTHQEATSTNELMQEFQSLLEAFYIEQRQNDASKDVIWLFEELEWRFEEIKRGYEEERLNWETRTAYASAGNDADKNVVMTQWRACMKDLVEAVQSQRNHGIHTDTYDAQNIVVDLQQRLSSSNMMHKQKMEALKLSHKKSSDEMCKKIQELQSQFEDQTQKMLQLQRDKEMQQNLILEERKHFQINSESMAARVRYLEEIVRSSDTLASPAARNARAQQLSQLKNGHTESEQSASVNSAPQLTPAQSDAPTFASAPVLNYFENSTRSANESLILSLRQQIDELGRALEESEEERAKAIEEFQIERQEHIRQYEELSNYVRQILDNDATICNGNAHV